MLSKVTRGTSLHSGSARLPEVRQLSVGSCPKGRSDVLNCVQQRHSPSLGPQHARAQPRRLSRSFDRVTIWSSSPPKACVASESVSGTPQHSRSHQKRIRVSPRSSEWCVQQLFKRPARAGPRDAEAAVPRSATCAKASENSAAARCALASLHGRQHGITCVLPAVLQDRSSGLRGPLMLRAAACSVAHAAYCGRPALRRLRLRPNGC